MSAQSRWSGKPRMALAAASRDEFMRLICETLDVSEAELLAPTRLSTGVSRKRHIAFYLLNVEVGLSFSEVGRMFGRARASIRYGCARVEDARDDAAFDHKVAMLERLIRVLDLHMAEQVAA